MKLSISRFFFVFIFYNMETRYNKYLTYAISIGNELFENFTRDTPEGLAWLTLRPNPKLGNVEYVTSENIYDGGAGILLFYVELYYQTKHTQYLNIINSTACWLKHSSENKPSDNYSFYTGRLGVSYALLVAYQVTLNKSYYDSAYCIVDALINKKDYTNKNHDLLLGNAGTLLGLILLYNQRPQSNHLNFINKIILDIINGAKIERNGLSWGDNTDCIKNLCGFSHGAAGISFSIMQAANFFNAESLVWLSHQAISYENGLFSKPLNNWPDLRKLDNSEYKISDFPYSASTLSDPGKHNLNEPSSNMFAWCHGAPGIAVSRIVCNVLSPNPSLRKDSKKAIKYTIDTIRLQVRNQNSFTICHGILGNLLCVLEYYNVTKRRKYLKFVEDLADITLANAKTVNSYHSGYMDDLTKSPDSSLFMGSAGIGYFFLKLNDFNITNNIIAPYRDTSSKGPSLIKADQQSFLLTTKEIVHLILQNHYPRTFDALNTNLLIEQLPPSIHSLYRVRSIMKNHIKSLKSKQPLHIFNLEDFKLYKYATMKSWAFCKHRFLRRNWPKSESRLNNNSTVVLCSDMKITSINFGRYVEYYLVMPTANSIVDQKISHFTYLVLNLFKNKCKYHTAKSKLAKRFDLSSIDGVAAFDHMFSDQVTIAINHGILDELTDVL